MDSFHVSNVTIDSSGGVDLLETITGTQVIFTTAAYSGEAPVDTVKINVGEKVSADAKRIESVLDLKYSWTSFQSCQDLPQGKTIAQYQMFDASGALLQKDQINIDIRTC